MYDFKQQCALAQLSLFFITLSDPSQMDDVVELYRLEATVSKDHIIHRVFSGDSLDEQVEQWRTVDRIGSGAAGEVRSEVEEATGRMRAVKVVNKAWLRGKMDYRRELLAMGILSKVAASTKIIDMEELPFLTLGCAVSPCICEFLRLV